jgi:GDP-4-dehydro-6-deoxy-D-mannose reductase
MRVLITGATGFVGTNLAAELLSDDPSVELWGTGWGDVDTRPLMKVSPSIRLSEVDLAQTGSITAVLESARPDVVYHLAAASSVARSWDGAAQYLAINAGGTANLFAAVLELGIDPVVVVSSTAEVYGRVDPAAGRVTESARLSPVSPYGTSKIAQDLLTEQFHTGRGLATVRLRFFHLTGPGRPEHFVASSFARQIARAEAGLAPPVLRVGNLDAVRDFTDVRDAVRACRVVADRRHAGAVFNVCSGRGTAISEVLEQLLGLSRSELSIEVDEERLRPADIPWMVGDPAAITAATGWRTEISLQETLSDLLDWWRMTR